MSVYYKGYVYPESNIKFEGKILLGAPAYKLFSKTKIDFISLMYCEEFLSNHEKIRLENFLKNEDSKFNDSYLVTDENIKKVLNKIIKADEEKNPVKYNQEKKYDYSENIYNDFKPVEIIFELFTDEYGNFYGKEIISNKTFPIFNENTRRMNPDYKIKKVKDPSLLSYSGWDYVLSYEWDFYYPNVLNNGAMIFNQQYATPDEVKEYLNTFQGIGNVNGIKLLKLLTNLSKNVKFSPDFQIEKVKETFDLDVATIIDNIEDLLLKLKEIDEEKYLEYRSKYDSLIQEKDNKVLRKNK